MRQATSQTDDDRVSDAANSGGFSAARFASAADASTQFKHWNIFFKDIFRVSIDIVDRETNKVITQQDLEKLLAGGGGGEQAAGGSRNAAVPPGTHNNVQGGAAQESSDRNLKIYFVLKIHYQVTEQGEDESVFTSKNGRKNAA